MTNNPTIDGVSRELLQKVDDLLYIMTGHDSFPRLKHKYGEQWWNPVNAMRAEICTMLAAPVVERQPMPGIVLQPGERLRETEQGWQVFAPGEDAPPTQPHNRFHQGRRMGELLARIAELESARGEPVAEVYRGPVTGVHRIRWIKSRTQPLGALLYTAPPAPAELALPDPIEPEAESSNRFHGELEYCHGWNACLDATAALNNKPSTEVKP